jgi:hypothetical protein
MARPSHQHGGTQGLGTDRFKGLLAGSVLSRANRLFGRIVLGYLQWMLGLFGATPEGKKELVGFPDGGRIICVRRTRSKACSPRFVIVRCGKLMLFKLVNAAAKTSRRLKRENQLPKIVRGVKFQNGIEVIEMGAHHAARSNLITQSPAKLAATREISRRNAADVRRLPPVRTARRVVEWRKSLDVLALVPQSREDETDFEA